MKSFCIAVPREKAELVRHELMEGQLLRTDLKIRCDENCVYLPVAREVHVNEGVLKKMDFKLMEKKQNFRDILASKISVDRTISSFDVIGDIAIIRIPSELLKYKEEIGDAILSTNKNIKVVCMDNGVRDDYRIRDLKVIAGEERTETIHSEYGAKIMVDVAKVYYSPRLATERKRTAGCVKPGDVVIDMFAGVAPFSVIIAKMAKPSKVYAIDVNPYAVKYANINVKRNGVDDIVEVMEGDAMDIIPSLGTADHIIMNLPHRSYEFFPTAVNAGKSIHYYEIIEKNKIEERLDWLRNEAKKKEKKAEIKNWRVVGSYSPREVKIGVDLLIC
ncbi:MAG: class I SAM-dependent methyltransferase family protein [Candidatus Thermoplasmatota archaeon]|nr:class I SAM-dependent methyltransferase family protein [Candidatus Thermoplasmatota archaeon]